LTLDLTANPLTLDLTPDFTLLAMDSRSDQPPVGCDLTGAPDTLAERLAEYRRLFAAHLIGRERTGTGIRFRFRTGPGVEDWVRDLARREKACCAFFDFTSGTSTAGEIWWDATVIDDDMARQVLDEFYRLPDTGKLERLQAGGARPDSRRPAGAAAARGRDRGRGPSMTAGTRQDPWVLKTPPGSSAYTMYRDEAAEPPALVCQVGSTTLKYRVEAIDDLHAWLTAQGDWVPLGAADEKKPAAPGTVEEWGRSPDNPAGGWYGLRNGYRGRFGMYLPPLLEALGLAELTHDARNNRMRAI
jgi:hypothetical protein